MKKQIATSLLLFLSACGGSENSDPGTQAQPSHLAMGSEPRASLAEDQSTLSPAELNLTATATQPFFRQATRRDGKKSHRFTASLKIALPQNLQLKLGGLKPTLLIPNKSACPKLQAKFTDTNSEGMSEMILSGIDDPKLNTQPCLKFIQEVHRAGAVFRFENVATSNAIDAVRIPEVTLQIQTQTTLRN